MSSLPRLFVGFLRFGAALVATAGLSWAADKVQGPAKRPLTPSLGKAIDAVVNPTGKRRGTLQRNSLAEVVASRKKDLQFAFLLDGTDSMGRDIKSALETMKSIAAGLRLPNQPDARLSFALVIYRDSHSPSGQVQIPLKRFTTDVAELEAALAKVQTETGAPYFRELVDVGLHTALSELDWTPVETPNVTRWILVCGDAPPYAEGNADDNSKVAALKWKSGRFHTDAELIDLAKAKGVQLSAVICGSGFNNPAVKDADVVRSYESYLPQARKFFGKLAEATGGGVLDLSRPDVAGEIVAQADKQRYSPVQFARITQAEIEQTRLAISQPSDDSRPKGKSVRIGVVPHLPMSQLSERDAWQPNSDKRNETGQMGLLVATEIEQKLRLIPGVSVRNAEQVQTAFFSAFRNVQVTKATGEEFERQLRTRLAGALGVDYLIGGTYSREGQSLSLRSGLYKRVDGSLVAEAAERVELTEADDNQTGQLNLPSAVLSKLLLKAGESLPDAGERKVLGRADEDTTLRGQISQPLSQNLTAQRYLLYGLGSLERSLAHFRGDSAYRADEVKQLLETAVGDLKSARDHAPENPCAHLFLASCYYNLASSSDANGPASDYLDSLRKAYELRDRTDQTSLQEEIAADYALLIEKNPALAISHYEKLTTPQDGDKANFALRAHWMLAGIYSGDWGVPSDQIDAARARQHILQILARWEESPEAKFYQEHLVDKKDPQVPLVANNSLLSTVR